MVRTEDDGLLRQKTQVGGRSSRAVVARPMACSALGGEPRGDRENPRQQRLIEQETFLMGLSSRSWPAEAAFLK